MLEFKEEANLREIQGEDDCLGFIADVHLKEISSEQNLLDY